MFIKGSKIFMLLSLLSSSLLPKTSHRNLPKDHEIRDHDSFLRSYHGNSSAANLNKQELKTSRRINNDALINTGASSQNRIMVVDDEQDIARLFAITLEDSGFIVDVFNDSLSALSNYKAGLYDLLLLDVKMPKMNGFELYQKIKAKDDKANVCFISAYEGSLNEFKKLFPNLEEVDCFVRKPIELLNLVKLVKSKIKYN